MTGRILIWFFNPSSSRLCGPTQTWFVAVQCSLQKLSLFYQFFQNLHFDFTDFWFVVGSKMKLCLLVFSSLASFLRYLTLKIAFLPFFFWTKPPPHVINLLVLLWSYFSHLIIHIFYTLHFIYHLYITFIHYINYSSLLFIINFNGEYEPI